jgi:tyrosine decarboxylase/aspartate 1-decarboxylase
MLNEGLSKHEIIKLLEEKLSKDFSYESGSILGSMCTDPLDFGKEIYSKYLHKNLGDPGLFQGSAELEEELIAEIGGIFNGSNIIGTITTGGSEANIIAMRIAKKLRPDIKNPEIIVPISAHKSFDKAEDFLGFKIQKVHLKENFELDLNHFESLINKNTVGVVGIAGTTSLGLIDPIEDIGKIIEGKELFFHVDAAFGGFVLPFLNELGYKVPKWDFSVNAVDSITADPHKMGLGLIPTGGFFIRDPATLRKTGFEIPYLAGGNFKHFHIVGTRPGGTVIAFWAIMKYLGKMGFIEIVKKCMDNTNFLVKKLNEIKGIKLANKPSMNVVGFTTENGESICEIEEELRKRDWMLGKFIDFNIIRIVIMPHVKKSHLSKFAEDLEIVVKTLGIST